MKYFNIMWWINTPFTLYALVTSGSGALSASANIDAMSNTLIYDNAQTYNQNIVENILSNSAKITNEIVPTDYAIQSNCTKSYRNEMVVNIRAIQNIDISSISSLIFNDIQKSIKSFYTEHVSPTFLSKLINWSPLRWQTKYIFNEDSAFLTKIETFCTIPQYVIILQETQINKSDFMQLIHRLAPLIKEIPAISMTFYLNDTNIQFPQSSHQAWYGGIDTQSSNCDIVMDATSAFQTISLCKGYAYESRCRAWHTTGSVLDYLDSIISSKIPISSGKYLTDTEWGWGELEALLGCIDCPTENITES